jgi:hypothetical protein
VTSEEVAGACAAAVEPVDDDADVLEADAPEADVPVEAVVAAEADETTAEPAEVLVEDPFGVESSELQPLSTAMNEIHTNPAQALSAPTLNTIVTCSYCYVMSGRQATKQGQSHAGNASLPSVTPLSAACRPEALRPRLATGLPLNGV